MSESMDDKAVAPSPALRRSSIVGTLGQIWRNLIRRQEVVVLALLLVVAAFLSLWTDTFLSVNNLSNVFRNFSWIAIAALGQSLVIIIGGIDLSVGATMALSGLITALCMQQGLPVPWAIAAGLLTGCLVGGINGLLVGRVRLPAFIVTLGMMSVVRGIAFGLVGGWPIRDLPRAFRDLGQYEIPVGGLGVPLPVLFMLGTAILVSLLMNQTVVGRFIYTLSSGERALHISGVNVVGVKMLVYTLCGLLAALGGLLLTARLGVAVPTAATGYELDIIAAAVIGGTSLFGGVGSTFGVLLGAAVMQMLRNGLILLGFPAHWQTLAIGVAILAGILFDYWRRR